MEACLFAFTSSLHFVICVVGVFFSRFKATMNCSCSSFKAEMSSKGDKK